MKKNYINTKLEVPAISLGCMRISQLDESKAAELIGTAMDCGMNFFDHADIYGGGASEEIFARAVKANGIAREKMILQSKCGIRKGFYDFSKEHILASVDGILKRLNTEYLDILLLHRPDALVEPEEVAEAFQALYDGGKVKQFGVSNQNPMQIELLQKYINQKIAVNQLQLSVTNANMISAGMNVNVVNDSGIDRDGSVLDYCRLKDIMIQTWSPFQYGFFGGSFIGDEKYSELNKKLEEIGEKYQVGSSTIAIAWILRHPAGMQAVIGTTNAGRVKEIAKAADIKLTREEWYQLYLASGYQLL